MNLEQIRQKYPQYKDVPDDKLKQGLYNKYYAKQMSFDEFNRRIGGESQNVINANDFVPTAESLAVTSNANSESNPSWVEQGIGAMENIGSMVSSIATEPVAGLYGVGAGLVPGGKTGGEAVEDLRGAVGELFRPKTPAGIAQQKKIAETLQPLGEMLTAASEGVGDFVYKTTGSPLLASIAYTAPDAVMTLSGGKVVGNTAKTYQSAAKQNVAQMLRTNPQSKKVGQYILDGAGEVQKSKAFPKAVSLGFDEATMAAVKGAGEADKAKMLQMLNVLEKGQDNARFAVVNRPSDVIGNSALDRVVALRRQNRQAGQKLERAANNLKGKEVDFDTPVNQFISDLNDIGVTFDNRMRPNFRNADIEGAKGAERLISKLVKRMRDTKTPDAYDVHRLKKFIDEQVAYGKAGKGLTGRAESIVKSLRHNLDQQLDNRFVAYDKANVQYSDTIRALDALQSGVGRLDLTSPNASQALGTALRRVMSNAQSRANLIGAIDEIDTVSRRYGASFDDDLITLSLFSDELDSIFQNQNRTTLRGQNIQAGDAVVEGQQGVIRATLQYPAERINDGVNAVRGRTPEGRIQALRDLLNE